MYLLSRRGQNICILTLKGLGQNLTWHQGHVRLRFDPGRLCISVMRLGERNTLVSIALLYLYSIKSYRQKTHLTSYDVEWLKGELTGSNLLVGHWKWPGVRQYWDNQHDLSRAFGVRSIWTFSLCLIMVWSEYWPDLRSWNSKFRDKFF